MVAQQRVAIILFRDARASRKKVLHLSIYKGGCQRVPVQIPTKHVACVVSRLPLHTIQGLVAARISPPNSVSYYPELVNVPPV